MCNKRYTFGITNKALCSFCNTLEETPTHIFFECIHIKCLWEKLRTKFHQTKFYPAVSYTADCLSWTIQKPNDNYNLLSQILLIFKYYIYMSKEKRILNIDILIANLIKVRKVNKPCYRQ